MLMEYALIRPAIKSLISLNSLSRNSALSVAVKSARVGASSVVAVLVGA